VNFPQPTLKGKIIKRYKRFLADIELEDGTVLTAHTANTGSMKTCWEPGWPAFLSHGQNPDRKYAYNLEMLHNGQTWIGVNTARPNKLVAEAIENGVIKELSNYQKITPEVTIGDSRIDLFLENSTTDEPGAFVEIKNVTLLGEKDHAYFPDSESTRGQKHLSELIQIKKLGYRAVIFYLVQRQDVSFFSPAWEIDPAYADLLTLAIENGVEVLIYGCDLTEESIKVSQPLKLNWQA
jgi:sugar fermentation stimulation protein A